MQRIQSGKNSKRMMTLMGSFVKQVTGNKSLQAYGAVRDQLIAELTPLFRTYEADNIDGASAIVSVDNISVIGAHYPLRRYMHLLTKPYTYLLPGQAFVDTFFRKGALRRGSSQLLRGRRKNHNPPLPRRAHGGIWNVNLAHRQDPRRHRRRSRNFFRTVRHSRKKRYVSKGTKKSKAQTDVLPRTCIRYMAICHSQRRQSHRPAEQLAQYLGPMFAQFAELETEGILLCGEYVPIHFVFCLDGKAHQQTIGMSSPNHLLARARLLGLANVSSPPGSDPFCCRKDRHPCPLCLVMKMYYLNKTPGQPRINDPKIALVKGGFIVADRFFVDSLHLGEIAERFLPSLGVLCWTALARPSIPGLRPFFRTVAIRLLEFFLQTLADELGVSGRPNGPRERWKEFIATISGNITMNPYCRNEGKYEYSLPSRPMAVYKKVARDFPYDLAFPGHNDPRLHIQKFGMPSRQFH